MSLEKLANEVKDLVDKLDTISRVSEKYASEAVGTEGTTSTAVLANGLYTLLEKEASAREQGVPELVVNLAHARGNEISHEVVTKLSAASIVDEFLEKKAEEEDTDHLRAVQSYGREFYASVLKEVL